MGGQAEFRRDTTGPRPTFDPRKLPSLLPWLGVAVAAGLVLALTQLPDRAETAPVQVTATVETSPAVNSGDAIDDPAVWVHPTNPSLSTIIDTDKRELGGLNVYDLSGQRLYFYQVGRMNNVDVRYNFPLGGSAVDLVGASNRVARTLDFYKVNVADRSLTSAGSFAVSSAIATPRGFAFYHSPDSGKYYAFVADVGHIDQYELSGATGAVTGTLVRQFALANPTEGLVADDELKRVYVAEENVGGIWRYGAEPGDGTTGVKIDSTTETGGNIVQDVKGISLYYASNGAGYLLAASQGGNSFHVYNRGNNAHLGEFEIVTGNGIDPVTGQDGIDVTNVALGSAFPQGLFITQDTSNSDAGNGNSGNQNNKIVPWQSIANAISPPLTIDTSFNPRAIGAPGGSPTPTPSPSSTATPTPTETPAAPPSPAATGTPSDSVLAGGGKGVALRPFAEYWGSNLAGMNSDFADMNAGDISWARLDLYPTDSPNPAFDAAVQGAQSHNINLLVAVHKTPPGNDLGTDADRAVYRTWLAGMVNRYKYYVRHWEIQNEPNLHYEWNIDESSGSSQAQYVASVQRYVMHLQDGYETVKANDPGATVLFGGLSEWTVERYMDVLITTEAYRYFDVMSFHPYGSDPDRVLSRFNSFVAKMNLNPNYASKPIWVTEAGFNTSWTNLAGYVSSEQIKADYLAEIMPRLHAAGAQLPIFWYTLHENENASGFGLILKDKVTLDTQYYQAFYAYRDLALGPAPTSTLTPTATAAPTPSATPASTPSPTATATPAPTVTPSPTPTPTPTSAYVGASSPAEAMSIDGETTGNLASSVGPRDPCVQALAGGTVTFDLTVLGIPPYSDGGTPGNPADDSGGIIAYSYRLQYDSTNLTVTAQDPNFLLAVNSGSSLFTGASDSVPDTDGSFAGAVLDTGTGVPESGNGVLDRLSIAVSLSASGLFPLTLTGNGHVDSSNTTYAPAITNNGSIAVGTDCPGSPPNDSDGDGVLNATDNCPHWLNPTQALPPWPGTANDPDCDGFSSSVENSAGTNALAQCGANSWPADINNNGFSDTADISALTADFGFSVPPAPARHNIAPDPVNAFIDTADIAKMTAFFSETCVPPTGTPTPTPTSTPTATPTATPTSTATPTFTPTATPTATPTPTPTPAPAGIVFGGASTTVTTASATIDIAKPAGTASGDVLVASLALNGTTVSGVPSGWVQVAAVTNITNPKLYGYYHVAGSSEPASYTWTLSSAVASSGGIARYSGVNNASPLAATPMTASAAAVMSLTVPAVTTALPNSVLIGAVAINSSNTAITITSPSGMTERWDLGGKRQDYADGLQPGAGNSGDKTWTFPVSSGRDAAGWLAALRPQ